MAATLSEQAQEPLSHSGHIGQPAATLLDINHNQAETSRPNPSTKPTDGPPPSTGTVRVDIKYSNINPQSHSLLLSRLPPEILHHIYTYVFTADPDPDLQYAHTSRVLHPVIHHPRKSHTLHLSVDTSPLQTCKRIYFAARTLPISLNEHIFWPRDFREPIEPSTLRYKTHSGSFFRALQPWQRDAVRSVRFNVPETLCGSQGPNLINQKIGNVFMRLKFAGLVDSKVGIDLKNLRRLVVDLHQPVFWGDGGWRYECRRGLGMVEALGIVRDGVTWMEQKRRERARSDDSGLRELVVVLDHWIKGRTGMNGSGVWEWVRTWEFRGMTLVDDGLREDSSRDAGYHLRAIKWVARQGV